MRFKIYYRILLTISLAIPIIITLDAQTNNNLNTPGEVTFTVKTITDNGNFAPKHVLAIWVEDDQGFVKTRKLRANQRKKYLYTWRSVSGDNVVDATTGATMSSHQTHTIIWDCTDVDGNVVPDGDYTIYIEFTEKHAQGPIASFTFTKSIEEQHLTPDDEENFINISLDFIPETTDITDIYENKLTVFPNPGNGLFTIVLENSEALKLNVFNASGQKVFHQVYTEQSNQVQLDLSNYHSGIYFVEVKQSNKSQMVKVIKE